MSWASMLAFGILCDTGRTDDEMRVNRGVIQAYLVLTSAR